MKEFLSTLWGRVLAVLAVFALLMGIAAEAVSLYRGWQEAQINQSRIEQAKAEACSARAKAILETLGRRADPVSQEFTGALEQIAKDCGPQIAKIEVGAASPSAPPPSCPAGQRWNARTEKCVYQHRPDSVDVPVQR